MNETIYTAKIIFLVLFSTITFGQSYRGPATGTVSTGVTVTTDDFLSVPAGQEPNQEKRIRKLMEYDSGPVYYEGNQPVFDDYVYVEDANASVNTNSIGGIGTSFELHSFNSIPMQAGVPPDPHMAVGPNHVIATVNSRFHIYDREGNLLKNIDADAWCGAAVPNPGAFDPQIIYDHYEGRWFMLWDSQSGGTQTAWFIISYSDDEDPLGTWYMYALDATKNGNNPSSPLDWGDYPQIGYDDQGIYISSRQFAFAGSFTGGKIRILNKSELYTANGGPLNWIDLWDIRILSGADTDDLHPCISYDAGTNVAYIIHVPNAGNFYTLYKITDPVTDPVLVGIDFPVPAFGVAPDANQLGGGSPRIDAGAGGSGMRDAPIIRDGKLYAAHHIQNSQFADYGSIKYFVIDLNTLSVVEQVEQGAEGYFYVYPSIAVDQDHNLAITYSRSADTEYIGSYYSTKLGTDPPGLSQSKVMVEGKGNYVVGSTRNRWGDYLSAALDPVNQSNIWLYSEYAAAENRWGTWLTEIRMKPIPGVFASTITPVIEHGNTEVSTNSTITAILANYGEQDLVITDIPSSAGEFTLDNLPSLPLTLSTYDSLSLDFTFSPTDKGDAEEFFAVTSNDPNFGGFTVRGFGYTIFPALDIVMYASSGALNGGNISYLDKASGDGTNIGPSSYNNISSISISPLNNELFGVAKGSSESQILRINSLGGDAYLAQSLDVGGIVAIAFDTSGTLYGALESGELYSIDLTNGTYNLISTAPIDLIAITFDPITNDLWATRKGGFGEPKDALYKIDLPTGDTTTIGQTGYNVATNDLAFDENGVLYGIKGAISQVSDLFSIDVNTGAGTMIGSVGLIGLTGLAYAETGVVSVEKDENNDAIPAEFVLSQNYPNPFNPTTSIEFSIPVNSNVTLIIYNLLGQVVSTLVNEEIGAGNYNVVWNGEDRNGLKVSSSIYLYKMQATGTNGKEFQQIRKMVLLK
jgi:hypothetical protein